MKKVISFLVMLLSISFFTAQESIKKDEIYIQTFAKVAVQEMELYKIPASITLAQGILETGNGQSRLAKLGNNHFGIKCKEEWTGGKMYHDDDARDECFRTYTSAEDSYRDHSLFLAERAYYKKLFTLNPTDYKAWAHGLKKAGYATNSKYAYILINLIEKHRLYQFDQIPSQEVHTKLAQLYPNNFNPELIKESVTTFLTSNNIIYEEPPVFYKEDGSEIRTVRKTIEKREDNNFDFPNSRVKFHPNGGMKYIVIHQGDELKDISRIYNVSIENLRRYNDLTYNPELKENQLFFLEPKKTSAKVREYIVREGDNMYDISQNYGISLLVLYRNNNILPGKEPKPGEKISLQGRRS